MFKMSRIGGHLDLDLIMQWGGKKIPGGGVYVFPMKNRIIGVPGRKESYLAFCFVILN